MKGAEIPFLDLRVLLTEIIDLAKHGCMSTGNEESGLVGWLQKLGGNINE